MQAWSMAYTWPIGKKRRRDIWQIV